jgi:predicted DCC family thiol-disulfide oxidoreductase YuxK
VRNGWTGGQYSLFRAIFGCYLCLQFARLAPWAAELFSRRGLLADGAASPLLHLFPNLLALWDGPGFSTALVMAAAALALPLAVGWHDRPAAVALWYLGACLYGRMPLIGNPALPYIGWMLLAHACLPPSPYGSLAARARPDPGNDWRMPRGILLAAWILMALGYTYSGLTKLTSPSWLDGSALARVLDNPLARPGPWHDLFLALPDGARRLLTWGALGLEIGFAPLALLPRVRPWIWSLMLVVHLKLILLLDFADLSLGMVMLHLFTFDPGWIRPRAAGRVEMIFYDGGCGLCHRAVRFVLAEDRNGAAFRFAPLDSDILRASIPAERRAALPDSLVVLTVEGKILVRSRAVRRILQRLGGGWRLAGGGAALLPAALLDRLYDGVARIRHRLFAPPPAACPIVPRHLRDRFAA